MLHVQHHFKSLGLLSHMNTLKQKIFDKPEDLQDLASWLQCIAQGLVEFISFVLPRLVADL